MVVGRYLGVEPTVDTHAASDSATTCKAMRRNFLLATSAVIICFRCSIINTNLIENETQRKNEMTKSL